MPVALVDRPVLQVTRLRHVGPYGAPVAAFAAAVAALTVGPIAAVPLIAVSALLSAVTAYLLIATQRAGHAPVQSLASAEGRALRDAVVAVAEAEGTPITGTAPPSQSVAREGRRFSIRLCVWPCRIASAPERAMIASKSRASSSPRSASAGPFDSGG